MLITGYYVFKTNDGGLWLADDERNWTNDFDEAACFRSAELARDIGDREKLIGDTLHVFALMR